MSKLNRVVGCVGLALACAGCGSGGAAESVPESDANRLVLDVRCSADAECPAGFECELEDEHGVQTSFCVAHRSETADGGAAATTCPAGFETEVEHGGTFCKAHGGDGKDGPDGGATAATPGATCATDADCGPGLECEVELEHGATTSSCKAHGGGKGGGGKDD